MVETHKLELTSQQVLEIKSKLDSGSESERMDVILNIIDNYAITDEIRKVLLEYKDIINMIKDENKILIQYLTDN